MVVNAAASGGSTSGGRRVVYRQSQGGSSFNAPVNQVASFVVPAGVFVAVTFGMQIEDFCDFLEVFIVGIFFSSIGVGENSCTNLCVSADSFVEIGGENYDANQVSAGA